MRDIKDISVDLSSALVAVQETGKAKAEAEKALGFASNKHEDAKVKASNLRNELDETLNALGVPSNSNRVRQ